MFSQPSSKKQYVTSQFLVNGKYGRNYLRKWGVLATEDIQLNMHP